MPPDRCRGGFCFSSQARRHGSAHRHRKQRSRQARSSHFVSCCTSLKCDADVSNCRTDHSLSPREADGRGVLAADLAARTLTCRY